MAGLHFDITGDNSNFMRKLEETRSGVIDTSKRIEESGMSIEQMYKRMTSAAAGFGVALSTKEIVSNVVRVRGEFQQLEVAFRTMLGSEEQTNTLMRQLVNTAAKTPFDLQGVGNGAKQLLAYGTAAEDVNGTLVRLGDIAAGLSIPLGDLVYLYGTTMTQGRLFTQDLRQFQGRGIPLADELAKQFGVAKDKVGELVTAGKVGFPEVQKAIEAMTNDGGKFGGLMESQSKTITGQISNIEDAISTMYNNIGKQSEGFINDALSGVFYLVENYETIGKTILELAAVYGTYKAVLISVTAVQKINSIILKQAILEKKLAAAAGIMLSNSEAIAASQTKILTIAQTNLTKAIKLTTSAMLANPFVLAAAAIAGVSFAIYKVVTAETELDKAHKRFNDATKDIEKSLSSEVLKLTSLERKLSEAKKGTEEYNSIKKTIVDNYGKYYKGLDGEIERVGNLSSVYGQLVENMRLSIGQRKFESFFKTEQDNLDKVIGEKLDKAYNTLIEKYGKDKGAKLYQQVFDYAIRGISMPVDTWKQLGEATFNELGFDNSPVWFAVRSVSSLVGDMNQATQASSKALDDFKAKYQMTEKDVENILSRKPIGVENVNLSTVSDEISTATKRIAILKQELSDLRSGKTTVEVGKTVQSVIEEKSKELKTAENALATLTGKTIKETDKGLKSQQDLSRSILDADLKFQSERIAILEDGRKKRLAQSEIEHKQQKAAIEKEYQDTIQKYKDLKQTVPETVETTYKARLQANDEAKTIRDKRINEEMDKALMERQKEITSVFLSEEQKRLNAIKERYDKEREWAKKTFQSGSFSSKDDYEAYLTTINDAEAEERKKSLLDKHQDYTDRRLAIEKKFNDDIATLQAERRNVEVKGQTDMVQQIDRAIAQATRDKAQSLVSLDFEQLKKRPEYIRAFENLKQTSSETLGSLLTQLENAKQTAAEVLSPDQLREYTSTIESIMDELTERNPFQALAERKKELAEAEEELANAKRNLDYVNGGGKIVTGMNYDKNTGKTEQSYLSSTQALENYNKAKDKAVKANARVIDAEKKASNVIRKLGDSLQDVGDSMGGLGGEIISIIGSITSTVMAGIEGMQNASEIGAAAIRTIEKASVILAIISAALQIANKIASLFKQTDYMAEFRKEMEELNYELELTRLNAEISTDENSIFGDDLWRNAIKNVLLANEVFMKYNDTLKEISDRKKYTGLMGIITENKGLKNSYDSLADSLANMQIQIRHSTWFRSAKYSSLKDAAPELFNADGTVNMDALKGFLGTDTFKKLSEENQKYLQEMSDYWETYQEAVDQVKGYLTNIFGELGNTMSDALVDAFENGTDAAQAFTDSVVDMLETLAKQMIYSITLTPVIENAQKKMLDVTKNEKLNEEQKFNNYISILDELTDGVLSEQERYNKFLEKYQEMAAQKGFDIFTPDEEEKERTATAKATVQASQDSVDKVTGIATVVQEYTYKIYECVDEMRVHNIKMTEGLSYLVNLKDINEKLDSATKFREVISGHLGNIEEYTSYCKKLEAIEDSLAGISENVERAVNRGIYLK